MRRILIKPLITEQSMAVVPSGKFTFVVDVDASKHAIKKEVEKAFSVNVVGISTTTVKGRTKRVGMRRSEKVVSPWKKAVVQLQSGQKIGLFELGGE